MKIFGYAIPLTSNPKPIEIWSLGVSIDSMLETEAIVEDKVIFFLVCCMSNNHSQNFFMKVKRLEDEVCQRFFSIIEKCNENIDHLVDSSSQEREMKYKFEITFEPNNMIQRFIEKVNEELKTQD